MEMDSNSVEKGRIHNHYQWIVMLYGDLLTTWTTTESPSVTSIAGPGSCPFTTVTRVSLHRCVMLIWLTYTYTCMHGRSYEPSLYRP